MEEDEAGDGRRRSTRIMGKARPIYDLEVLIGPSSPKEENESSSDGLEFRESDNGDTESCASDSGDTEYRESSSDESGYHGSDNGDVKELVGRLERVQLSANGGVGQKKSSKFCSWNKYDYIPDPSYGVFMKSVSKQLFHLDAVERRLTHALENLLKTSEGKALTLYGKQGSGKRTIINQVFEDREDINLVVLDGKTAKMLDIKQKLKTVNSLSDKNAPTVFVLFSFDVLLPTCANKVLYTLSNELQKKPMLLLLVSEHQNAFESLEKRIVSRIGLDSIKCMDGRLTSNDCWQIVQQMVKEALKNCEKQHRKAFKLPADPPKYFDRLCNRLPCYAQLKLFVKQLADQMFDSIEQCSVKCIDEVMLQILKPVDTNSIRLRTLTDRMHGLLISAAISTKHITQDIKVGSIFREYKKFLNTFKVSAVAFQLSEADFHDDIEYIVYQYFWSAKCQNDKIVSITWLEDPIKLLADVDAFNSSLQFWLKNDLKDDSKLR